MRVGSASAAGNVPGGQMAQARAADSVSKKLQNEISDAERQRQKLSSEEGISVQEKMKKRQELRQEISGLNVRLGQREKELSREQQREALTSGLRDGSGTGKAPGTKDARPGAKDTERKDTGLTQTQGQDKGAYAAQGKGAGSRNQGTNGVRAGNTRSDGARGRNAGTGDAGGRNTAYQDVWGMDSATGRKDGTTGLDGAQAQGREAGAKAGNTQAEEAERESGKEKDIGLPRPQIRAIVAMESAMEQEKHNGTVIAQMEGGIVILKGEISRDASRGVDVSRKQDELKEQEEKAQQASASRFSALGKAFRAMRDALLPKASGSRENAGQGTKANEGDRVLFKATNYVKESRAAQEQYFTQFLVRS